MASRIKRFLSKLLFMPIPAKSFFAFMSFYFLFFSFSSAGHN